MKYHTTDERTEKQNFKVNLKKIVAVDKITSYHLAHLPLSLWEMFFATPNPALKQFHTV